MSIRLKELTLRGFKSIRELNSFEPGPMTVLIGANGAGKSNFISFFRMLSWMMVTPNNLQDYISVKGGANVLLHDGAETTPQVEAELCLETEKGENDYRFRLFHAAEDTLIFADEAYRFSNTLRDGRAEWKSLASGHRGTKLIEAAEQGDLTARTIRGLLMRCKVYQFHNTSDTARMRGKWKVDGGRWLREDAGNLASFLLRVREQEPAYYARIVETARRVLPFFADFELGDEYGSVLLRWRERGSDVVFGPSQASDGMLRALALIALLQQKEDDLPGVLFLDEPELGLHPYAVAVVAGLLRTVSQRTQVVLATQSTEFLNHFEPEEIVVVEREGRESVFRRLQSEGLAEWLEEYSISELWEKNVIGGRPSR